jgi:hypothetical protein
MENITPFEKFKDIKVYKTEKVEQITELVDALDDMYRVTLDVDMPKSLINAFIKKVKDESNKDLRQSKSEMQLAEQLVKYVNENYLTIENLPVSIVVSTDQKAVQSQVQSQVQPQVQDELPAQEETQVQVSQPEGDEGVQVQTTGQPTQAQAQMTAQEIPAQEI